MYCFGLISGSQLDWFGDFIRLLIHIYKTVNADALFKKEDDVIVSTHVPECDPLGVKGEDRVRIHLEFDLAVRVSHLDCLGSLMSMEML